MKLEKIEKLVYKCENCDLHKTRINSVFGKGNFKSNIVFLIKGPDINEDKIGSLFIGKIKNIFVELLKSIKMEEKDIYITSIMKCHSKKGYTASEILSCSSYLSAEINNIKPKIICPIGNFATNYTLKKYGLKNNKGIGKIHGKIFKVKNLYDELIIIPLYHPRIAINIPDMKGILLKDMKILEK